MKRFIIQSILFFIVTVGVLAILGRKDIPVRNNYMDASIDKQHLLDTTKQPRIILAGGSNLAFGIDSKLIQDSTNCHIVNMGLHAGLGLDYMINELKLGIQPNDIIIFSIEYFLKVDGDYLLKKQVAKGNAKAKSLFSKSYWKEIKEYIEKDYLKNLRRNMSFEQKEEKTNVVNVYARDAFNRYGDVVKHLSLSSPRKKMGGGEQQYRYWEGIEVLNVFNQYAKERNVKIYLIPPSYSSIEYERNKMVLQQYQNDLNNNLEIELLGNPEYFIFNDSLLFDAIYHLNKEGRRIRTLKLIKIIKENKICSKE